MNSEIGSCALLGRALTSPVVVDRELKQQVNLELVRQVVSRKASSDEACLAARVGRAFSRVTDLQVRFLP